MGSILKPVSQGTTSLLYAIEGLTRGAAGLVNVLMFPFGLIAGLGGGSSSTLTHAIAGGTSTRRSRATRATRSHRVKGRKRTSRTKKSKSKNK